MPINKADLLAALKTLSHDELRAAGLRPAHHPFAPAAYPFDRVKRTHGSERWYQLVRGDEGVELHISQAGTWLHRYARAEQVDDPDYLLHGFRGVEGAEPAAAPELADATDDDIWAALERKLQ